MKNLVDVGLSFTKQLLLNEGTNTENTVFSPLSINAMLALIGSGSKGATQNEILSLLGFKSKDELTSFSSEVASLFLANDESSHHAPRLLFANSLWIDKSYTLKPSFKHLVDHVYKAAVNQVDFQTKGDAVRKEVNLWVETNTKGLIKEILRSGSVNEETRLILANALYFKGTWKSIFRQWETKVRDFHLLEGTSVKVSFMTSTEKQIVSCFDGFKVLKLPYEQGGRDKRCFSMYIFLTDSNDGLPFLVDKLCSESGFLDRHLPHEHVPVGKFLVPKFKISLDFEASDILQRLGLELLWTSLADLTEMVVDDNLYVSKMLHKSFIQVDELGTEAAAAATVVCSEGSCLGRKPNIHGVDFVADHPFLFLIREDETGAVLFLGHLLNPRLDGDLRNVIFSDGEGTEILYDTEEEFESDSDDMTDEGSDEDLDVSDNEPSFDDDNGDK